MQALRTRSPEAAAHLPGDGGSWARSFGFWLLAFTVSLPLVFAAVSRHPQLYDNDAYYHLAVARAYAEEGILDDLRWARFSALGEGFGDKELLFHLLLRPFAAAEDVIRGGQLALAALLAAVFATLAWLARPVLSWGSLLLPFWLAFASTELAWRWVRLRPELLSLVVLLLALHAISRERYRLLGLLGLVYALSYTAFHAFLGLCLAELLFAAWARRRVPLQLVVYPALGTGLGLLLHPHFPKNLEIWVLQALEYFRQLDILDVGNEIRPNFTDVALMVNLGWLLGLLVLWLSARPREGGRTAEEGRDRSGRQADSDIARAAALGFRSDRSSREATARGFRSDRSSREATALGVFADVFGVAAVLFGALYLLMSRFSLYAIPFSTLWLLFELGRRGLVIGRWTRLPLRGGRVPVALSIAVCLVVSAPEARRQWQTFLARTDPGPGLERLLDREALSAAIPSGARVAAPWQQTPVYMLWAPQGRYLNVLDPVFLAAHDVRRYLAQKRLFEGRDPDVPLTASTLLQSDFVAYSPYAGLDLLTDRLRGDPRTPVRHRGINLLFEILPHSNEAFLLDWRVAPPGTALPAAAGADPTSWPGYPRFPDPMGAAVEGYVDTRRLGAGGSCVALTHTVEGGVAATGGNPAIGGAAAGATESLGNDLLELEFAPWGPSTLWHNETPLVTVGDELGAVLGRGVVVGLRLSRGENLLTVLTCPGKDAEGGRGFYLRRLPPEVP